MFKVRAHTLSNIIAGTVVAISVAFAAAFMIVLGGFFSMIDSVSGFFGSANVLMYLTIEFMFLFLVLYGTYVSVRRRDYKE